ncbi:MAG: MerR family DNA-binding transcriptional regulator, partial [Clostridia bacterium]|nr:MerR family DNA-binding transcriptional regulator [Clostridia bacterium]
MDDLYPIGKVAKIMGVSVQTLRYYSNIGLISPAY